MLLIFLWVFTLGISCKPHKVSKRTKQADVFKLNYGGYERSYRVFSPQGSDDWDKETPVLFHLHGGGGTAKGTAGLTFHRFNQLAERDSFIVVYPDAIEKNWNDGRKSDEVKAWKEEIDDVGFIMKVLVQVKKRYNADTTRIFTTGMSNGGFMSTRLLCEKSNVFRGGAVLTASISEDYLPNCNPSTPVALLLMNGTDDPLVPYDGGDIKVFKKKRGRIISTEKYLSFWQEKNGCSDQPTSRKLLDKYDDGTSVTVKTYHSCADRGSLILYTIHGGGHTWPSGKQYLGEKWIGKTSKEIVACDVIWEYFKGLE